LISWWRPLFQPFVAAVLLLALFAFGAAASLRLLLRRAYGHQHNEHGHPQKKNCCDKTWRTHSPGSLRFCSLQAIAANATDSTATQRLPQPAIVQKRTTDSMLLYLASTPREYPS